MLRRVPVCASNGGNKMAKYQVNSINEFKDRAIENNITLEDKRFFIGTD